MRLGNQVPAMSVLEVLQEICRLSFVAGDFEGAIAAGKEILPYVSARLAPTVAADPNKGTINDIMNDADPDVMDDEMATFRR